MTSTEIERPVLEPAHLLADIEILTHIEDQVIRHGIPKVLSRSLLFFAAQDVGVAKYIENGTEITLYDKAENKPCELAEAQTALCEFADKYTRDPSQITSHDALEALAELSDVSYNLAQLIGKDEFKSIIADFSVKDDLFTHLLFIAKAKYAYRYLNVDPDHPEAFVLADFVKDKDQIMNACLLQRRKDIPYEIEHILSPLFKDYPAGYLVNLLVENWNHISTMLHAVYSTARTVALELDQQNGMKAGNRLSLMYQLLPALRKIPSLQT